MSTLIDWSDACDASATAFRRFSAGEAQSPVRTRLALADGRRFAVMPSVDPDAGALGTKLVGYYPDNPRQGLARVTGVYALFDPATGLLLALMEGAALTNLRTAAGALVAARALAPPGWGSAGIIGSGGLGTATARAFLEHAQTIHLYSRTRANVERLATTLASDRVSLCDSAEALVQRADIVICATDTHTPLFDGRALRGAQLVMSLGANTPTTRELDAATVTAGRLFADSRAAVLAECGEIILAQREGRLPASPELTELGTVLAGTAIGRRSADETLVFFSTGLAVQDALTAQRIHRRALERGRGIAVELLTG